MLISELKRERRRWGEGVRGERGIKWGCEGGEGRKRGREGG